MFETYGLFYCGRIYRVNASALKSNLLYMMTPWALGKLCCAEQQWMYCDVMHWGSFSNQIVTLWNVIKSELWGQWKFTPPLHRRTVNTEREKKSIKNIQEQFWNKSWDWICSILILKIFCQSIIENDSKLNVPRQ